MAISQAKLTAKLIEKTVTEVGRQQTNVQGQGSGGSPFQQMMDSLASGKEMAANLGMNNQQLANSASGVDAISAKGINIENANLTVGANAPDGMKTVVDLVSEVNKGHMKMDGLINQILHSGEKFSNQELLAIQAHVFQFAQMTEMMVKTADQAVGSMKAVLNTNIQ